MLSSIVRADLMCTSSQGDVKGNRDKTFGQLKLLQENIQKKVANLAMSLKQPTDKCVLFRSQNFRLRRPRHNFPTRLISTLASGQAK